MNHNGIARSKGCDASDTMTEVSGSTVDVDDLSPTLKRLLYLGPFHGTFLHCSTQEKASIIDY